MRVLLKEAAQGRVPECLATKPSLRPDLMAVWRGWWQLHKRRRRDMGEPLGIEGAEIDSLLDRRQITDAETRRLWHDWIEVMDDAYCDWLAERREAKARADALSGDGR